MEERIRQELDLLRSRYEEVEYRSEGRWVRLWPVPTAPGWTLNPLSAAFQIPTGYAGTPPYGFYVPSGLAFNGKPPRNSRASPPSPLPFEGQWMMLSWTHHQGWHPRSDVVTGSNLLNWALSFRDRFEGGA